MNNWLKENDGSEISPKEEPLDSNQYYILRKDWVSKYYALLMCVYVAVCYIDEKWFYRTNPRRKLKVLKLGPYESEGDDVIEHPKYYHTVFL